MAPAAPQASSSSRLIPPRPPKTGRSQRRVSSATATGVGGDSAFTATTWAERAATSPRIGEGTEIPLATG